MLEAFSARGRLSPFEQHVFANKLLDGSFRPNELLRLLSSQVEVVRAGKRSSQALKQAILVLCVFAAMILLPVLLLDQRWLPVPATLVAVAMVLGSVRRYLRRFAMSAQTVATAYPFLTVLKHDVSPDEPMRVRIEFSEGITRAKRQEVRAPYQFERYHKVVDTIYSDPWFEGDARLTDGTLLHWRVNDELRVSDRHKRNSRGKHKRKMRHYKTSHIEISMSFPKKLYRIAQVPELAGYKVSLREKDARSMLTVKRVIKMKSIEPVDPRRILDVIAFAYRAAKPVRGAA